MIKRLLAVFLVVLMVLSVFACGDEKSEGESSILENNEESENSKANENDSSSGNEEGENSFKDESSTSDNSSDSLDNSGEISDIPDPIPQDSVVSFYACSDNLIHPAVYFHALELAAKAKGEEPDYSDMHNAEYDFFPIYEYIAEDIKNADISYINQESLIGGDCKPINGYPMFNTPVPMADTLKELGFDVVNLAHNHMLDSGDTRFLEFSDAYFKSIGVTPLGCYPTEESAEDIVVMESNGIKIAFLTYTYGTNGFKVDSDSTFVIPYFEKELIQKQVAIAKEKADFVIASCHWGYEGAYNPNDMQEEYAKYLCELEVDMILGMHPHCIQPMEWMVSESGYETLVVYSIGTMVSSMKDGLNTLSGIITMDIVKDGVTGEVRIDNPIFRPAVNHSIYTGHRVNPKLDTSFRDFKVYYLENYNDELASNHAVGGDNTLVGGGYSMKSLLATVYKYIPEEFLPDGFPKPEDFE